MHVHVHRGGGCSGGNKSMRPGAGRRLACAFVLSLMTASVELWGATRSGSLALLADAGHVAFDSLAIAVAFGAYQLARRPARGPYTWGFGRVEVLAAAANAVALLFVAAMLAYEGWLRVFDPASLALPTMVATAAVGLVCNGMSLALLETSRDNLGVRAAFLHVAGDVLVALAVIVGGVAMHYGAPASVDGALSVAIAAVLVVGAVRLLASVGRILMEAAPVHLCREEVAAAIAAIDGVAELTALRLWSITPEHHVATAEVRRSDVNGDAVDVGVRVSAVLRQNFALAEATVQVR